MTTAAVIGSPNSGKSLLFNRLTGLNHRVANYPGITVDLTSGRVPGRDDLLLIDSPGVYSLRPVSGDEHLAVDGFLNGLRSRSVDAVLCVIDTTRLATTLAFATQVIEACAQHEIPVVVAANMTDVLARHGLEFDAEGLAGRIGAPVVAVSAKHGDGLEDLLDALTQARLPVGVAAGAMDAGRLASEFAPEADLLLRTHSRLDDFFLHSWSGGLTFLGIMYLVFQSIFTWAAPLMDATEAAVAGLGGLVLPLVPAGTASAFVSDALFGGIGAFLVFVPLVFVLTLVVTFLEDSGYLARAAIIVHRPLRLVGLTGRSFIPMLTGVACAIPGIYAARTIESPRRRWLTYMAVPLMPCAARLPVYALLIAALIPANTALFGLVGTQGLAMFGVYTFGIVVALLVSALMDRSTPQTEPDVPFVLELPPYRLPVWRSLLRGSWDRARRFAVDAGPIIFLVVVVVWTLGWFPESGDLDASWLGAIGRWIEPVFEPLGLDWRYGVAIITSFLAREVFVGTLGTLFGIEGADEQIASLADAVRESGLSAGSAVALIVFFAIALQCVSTVAVLRRETGSWRLPAQMFVGYGVLAWLLAWAAFRMVSPWG